MESGDPVVINPIYARKIAAKYNCAVRLQRDGPHGVIRARTRIEFIVNLSGRFIIDNRYGRVGDRPKDGGSRQCAIGRPSQIAEQHMERLITFP